MLLSIEVSNYRSIMDPVELSMIAVDKDRTPTRQFDLLSEQVLTVASIYGPNASGKSNVLEAVAWLSHAVGHSLRDWDTLIPREPFRFGDGPSSPTTFDVEMIVDGVRYLYTVELDDSRVLYEALHSYPERRRRMLFQRDGDELSFRRGLASLLSGTRELLTPTTLALSAAMRFDDPEIRAVGDHLAGLEVVGLRRGFPEQFRFSLPGAAAFAVTERIFTPPSGLWHPTMPGDFSAREADELPSRDDTRNRALALLRFADLGIDDVQVVIEERTEPNNRRSSQFRPSRRLQLMHRVTDQLEPFEIFDESAGTQTWFAMIGPALMALQRGQILLIDEIDASIHPQLSARLLELFQDPDTNPKGAQLIFTTHDTSLLNHLNRDEIWLTEKDHKGQTTLTALAEYGGERVRRSVNLERAYLAGRFGAVPDLDPYGLHQSLSTAQGDR